MLFDILTLFPAMFEGPLTESILKRAVEAGLLTVRVHNIRDWTHDKHHVTDDYPYGGGSGMVMKPEPLFEAVEAVLAMLPVEPRPPVILMTPQGRPFTQAVAADLARLPRLVLVCGHYEGIDERVRQRLATDEISIGDYVLTGGELPAMVVLDAVARLAPGVLAPGSLGEESHSGGLLEYPHYTRPPVFRGWGVPDVLLSGNHAAIARWRRREALKRTRQRRPDMLDNAVLSDDERLFLADLDGEAEA